MFVILLFLFLCLLSERSFNFKKGNITNINILELNKDYYVKEDIINYCRFKYVYKINKHPIYETTKNILKFLKNKYSFYLVSNKCPFYFKHRCFNDILIKPNNITTSIKNNFFFSESYLYLPQVTSLYPNVLNIIRKIKNAGKEVVTNKAQYMGENIENSSCIKNEVNKNTLLNITAKSKTKKQNLKKKKTNYTFSDSPNICILSNVYRKDNIDKLHFPFFTQIDVYIKIKNELVNNKKKMLYLLCELLHFLFKKKYKWRIKKDFFDFTYESLQAEVFFNNKWIEILGCGIMKKKIFFKNNYSYNNCIHEYMAIGIGLERIAMILHQIPKIRDLFLYTTIPESSIPMKTIQTETEEKEKEKENKKKNAKIKENILTDCPQGEGSELKENIMSIVSKKGDKKRNEFLQFQNLYNIKNEKRDFSFYVNGEWDSNTFIKNILNLKNIKNIQFLKKVVLFDIFFNEEKKQTSYTYRFVYKTTTNDIKDQYIFRKCIKELHNTVIKKICSLYNLTVR